MLLLLLLAYSTTQRLRSALLEYEHCEQCYEAQNWVTSSPQIRRPKLQSWLLPTNSLLQHVQYLALVLYQALSSGTCRVERLTVAAHADKMAGQVYRASVDELNGHIQSAVLALEQLQHAGAFGTQTDADSFARCA